ncbi:MAG: hypothetical protein KUG76_05795 [Gammaproteobacteria bacterium]|nr:hypothetical protein [Gammaproteobacteria bacterium]
MPEKIDSPTPLESAFADAANAAASAIISRNILAGEEPYVCIRVRSSGVLVEKCYDKDGNLIRKPR